MSILLCDSVSTERIVIDPMYVQIGAALRKRRDEIGMTQATLASELGLSRTSITNIERGRQALLVHQLVQASRVLKLDPGSILKEITMQGSTAVEPASEEFQQLFAKLKPARKLSL